MKVKMTKRPTNGPVCPVWFEYNDEDGSHEVSLEGSFGSQHVSPTPMALTKHGKWIRVLFLKPGRYEYCFLVNGRRTLDPSAAQSATDAEGNVNSVLVVKHAASTRELLTVAA